MNLALVPGSRCLLIGANGAGKTTLLKILGGKHMVARVSAPFGLISQVSAVAVAVVAARVVVVASVWLAEQCGRAMRQERERSRVQQQQPQQQQQPWCANVHNTPPTPHPPRTPETKRNPTGVCQRPRPAPLPRHRSHHQRRPVLRGRQLDARHRLCGHLHPANCERLLGLGLGLGVLGLGLGLGLGAWVGEELRCFWGGRGLLNAPTANSSFHATPKTHT